MALDFFLTHFYRLVVHDVVLLSDVYWFYTQERKEGKSIQEFTEVYNTVIIYYIVSYNILCTLLVHVLKPCIVCCSLDFIQFIGSGITKF